MKTVVYNDLRGVKSKVNIPVATISSGAQTTIPFPLLEESRFKLKGSIRIEFRSKFLHLGFRIKSSRRIQ